MSTIIAISLVVLHVLVERARRIYAKHEDSHPVIKSQGPTLVPALDGYDAAFMTVQKARADKSEALRLGRASIEKLFDGVRSWLGMVRRDLPELALDAELDPASPDRVIGYTESLIAVIEERRERLPYAASLLEQIGVLLTKAHTDWSAAQEALGELQAQQRALREQALTTNRELIAFRRTLRVVLGSDHRDCQLLRVRRAMTEDDEVVVEAPIATAEPGRSSQPVVPGNGATRTLA